MSVPLAGLRLTRLLAATTLAIGLAAIVGFAAFVHVAAKATQLPPHADGIVALTGGPARIRSALRLLIDGKADRLLVTGIGGGADLRDLTLRSRIDPAAIADRVTLGRGAMSTRGNAEEIAAWAQGYAIRTLIVVTAFYHMPRALTEIHRAAPAVQLYPAAVLPADMGFDDGLDTWSGLRLLAEEYGKFLAAELDLTAMEPAASPILSAATAPGGRR
jgi:uncharacterized SAM-binding protein YcdF (DUF218 family)